MDSRDLSKNGTSQSSIPRHCSRIRGGMSRAVQLLRSILQFAQTMRSVSDLACHHKRVVADQLLLLIFRVQKRDIFKDHMGTCESIRTTPSHRHSVTVACPHDSFLLMIMHSFLLLQDPPLGGDMLLSCWQTTIAPVMTCTTVRDGTPIFEGL